MHATVYDEFRPFLVEVTPERDAVRVAPHGEIDLATVGRLRARIGELLASGSERLIFDMRDVTFMDSTGLRLVLELLQASRDDHWELAVTRVPPNVRRVFELSGVLDDLPLGEAETALDM